jgi:hypothetical protein
MKRSATLPTALSVLLVILSLAIPTTGWALKDLSDRLGFGFTYHHFQPSTGVSMRYHPDRYFGATGVLALNAGRGSHTLVAGAKINRNLVVEENALFYLGLGGFILSTKTGTTTETGAEADALGGVEFFLPGLPNLGIQLEAGLALRLMGGFELQTIGGGFASAGMHYYF